jgi:geranylgeranyl diphosphate synthase type I
MQRIPSDDAFEPFATRVRDQVESCLRPWLAARVSEAARRGREVRVVAEGLEQLVLRGGKRWRAALLLAAFQAYERRGEIEAVVPAGAALELLQAYLLAHDDWMDGDDERRGGPSVPAMMRAGLPGMADAASVLAGDLACGWAQRMLFELTLPPARVVRAAKELARMQEDVVSGQILDVGSACGTPEEVEAMHVLKTSSYSARGPLVMGAALAGAGEQELEAMASFGEPLGVAFQLRDDLLGTFGDPTRTGKPVGTDVRKGKRTSLVLEAMKGDASVGPLLERAARPQATDVDVAAAVEAIARAGAKHRVEERIEKLISASREALGRAKVEDRGLLLSAVVALAQRTH